MNGVAIHTLSATCEYRQLGSRTITSIARYIYGCILTAELMTIPGVVD